VLSNSSVSLNLTEIKNKLRKSQSLEHFIETVDLAGRRNDSKRIQSSFTNLINTLPSNLSVTFISTTPPSFVNHFEVTQPTSPAISIDAGFSNDINERRAYNERMISDDGREKKERKYPIPLALTKTSENEKTASIFHGSSTNIDDLKRHILLLQNLTKSDNNFQSKFVVFPSLQKNRTTTTSTTTTTGILAFLILAPPELQLYTIQLLP
jgi:hypothetical protein